LSPGAPAAVTAGRRRHLLELSQDEDRYCAPRRWNRLRRLPQAPRLREPSQGRAPVQAMPRQQRPDDVRDGAFELPRLPHPGRAQSQGTRSSLRFVSQGDREPDSRRWAHRLQTLPHQSRTSARPGATGLRELPQAGSRDRAEGAPAVHQVPSAAPRQSRRRAEMRELS